MSFLANRAGYLALSPLAAALAALANFSVMAQDLVLEEVTRYRQENRSHIAGCSNCRLSYVRVGF